MSPSSLNTEKVLISLSSNCWGPDLTMLHISDSHLFVPPSRMCLSRKEPLSLFNSDARALLIYWILSGGVWCICQAQVSLGTSFKVSAAGTRNNISSGQGQKVRSRLQHENKHNKYKCRKQFSLLHHMFCFDSEIEQGEGFDGGHGSELHSRPLRAIWDEHVALPTHEANARGQRRVTRTRAQTYHLVYGAAFRRRLHSS